MFSEKISDLLKITFNKLGNGAFGSVYVAVKSDDNKNIALKIENKEKSDTLTLRNEFFMARKISLLRKYISLDKNNKSLDKNENIIIYKYITDNNLLIIPPEFDINKLPLYKCIPEIYNYIETTDYNYLTMDLCGDNFENLVDKFTFPEHSKYFIAYRLLFTLSCLHRAGVIHRDIKLANFVLSGPLDTTNPSNNKKLLPMLIDLGLSKEFYKFDNNKVSQMNISNSKSITGTIRYISISVHEYNTPTIIDDLISLCYCLIIIFTNKPLPWVGHKKDTDIFDSSKHSIKNCEKCNYHRNKANNNLKDNTIAEIKFHTDLHELTGNYTFLYKWLLYLSNLNKKAIPSYSMLYKYLKRDKDDINLFFDLLPKK
jgi:serine/threonine protein kinase